MNVIQHLRMHYKDTKQLKYNTTLIQLQHGPLPSVAEKIKKLALKYDTPNSFKTKPTLKASTLSNIYVLTV
ncbi:hypothetical protein C5167_013554 [Papaver somniferum]|uniref:Uncharacterized protein n=1 Tax=Papaver somniferum TaxID=3469 RepID=A0A4Y7J433_PAPSO|nr:hypothetical protein C5167_013554 [Papaver somniferum]